MGYILHRQTHVTNPPTKKAVYILQIAPVLYQLVSQDSGSTEDVQHTSGRSPRRLCMVIGVMLCIVESGHQPKKPLTIKGGNGISRKKMEV